MSNTYQICTRQLPGKAQVCLILKETTFDLTNYACISCMYIISPGGYICFSAYIWPSVWCLTNIYKNDLFFMRWMTLTFSCNDLQVFSNCKRRLGYENKVWCIYDITIPFLWHFTSFYYCFLYVFDQYRPVISDCTFTVTCTYVKKCYINFFSHIIW